MGKTRNNHDNYVYDFRPKGASVAIQELFNSADLNLPENQIRQTWEEIESFYISIGQGIVQTSQEINTAVRQINLLGTAENPGELSLIITKASSDLLEFTNALIGIHEKHADKTGIVDNELDHALMIQVFNEYVTLFEKFKAIVFPLALTVTEELAAAAKNAKKINEVEDAEIVETKETQEDDQFKQS